MTATDTNSTLEPWMRGTHADLDPVRRAVVHALEMAAEDMSRWCMQLDAPDLAATPAGLPSIAFHLRHIARSLDRLLTYAEDRALDEVQLAALDTEQDPRRASESTGELSQGIELAIERIRALDPAGYAGVRGIGRRRLPTTVGGLLIHCAEHTQRHAGQMVTTAKLLLASRVPAPGDAS